MSYELNATGSMPACQREFLAKHGYIAKNLIGEGAFGRVYRVWDDKHDTFWACKVASGSVGRNILRREAVLQRCISHPLFAAYGDCLEGREWTLLLMEYLEGESLAHYLKRGPLEQKQAVAVAMQLAQGINYLHELPEPILYRDLKPQNICLTEDGRVRLMDLGCACVISEAPFSRAGSPGYAPWEQMKEAEDISPLVPGFYSDVYALGRLLHYMLTGDDPCKPPGKKPVLRAYDRKLSPLLEQVVMQCVEERPELRPPDMRCVIRMLRPFETNGIRGLIMLKRKELATRVGGILDFGEERGFVYERNVCCQALQEEGR